MMPSPLRFSVEHPCRCGYDGEGVHRCHAGRDPRFPGVQCEREGNPRLAASFASLAGCQPKTGAVVIVYCAEHAVEAGFGGGAPDRCALLADEGRA